MDNFAEVNRLEKQVGSESERQVIGGGRVGKPPSGFGEIARRMTSRTTDLIAIGIVVVASLTLGRQVLVWWHAAPPNSRAAAAATKPVWEDQNQPISLEFGDSPVAMIRQVVSGEREALMAAMIGHCAAAAKRASRPWRERDEAEDRLLARIQGLTPVAEEAGVWSVYVFDERLPIAAAVRQFPNESDHAAGKAPRLVCWGTAMPAGKETWNLYLLQGAGTERATPADRADIPLPPGARRNLSFRDDQGGILVGFSGMDEAGKWIRFYDNFFADRGWSSGTGWLTGTGGWSAQFEEQNASAGRRVEIQFAEDRFGELSGLLHVIKPDSDLP
jgi:hypothetical protein